nr:hypothetical protein [Hyphomicrobiales bacterium]
MPKFQSRIPPGFPQEHRLGDALLFRELLGNLGRSTFARHLQLGLIPKADKRIGPLSRWFETTMAATIAALPSERSSKLRPAKSLQDEERAVA